MPANARLVALSAMMRLQAGMLQVKIREKDPDARDSLFRHVGRKTKMATRNVAAKADRRTA
ncbi:MAG: hypothetical protein U0X87_16835 [Anaerolineales bacterium]